MYGKKSSEFQVFVVQKLCQKNRKHEHDRHLNDQVKESIYNRLLKYFICQNTLYLPEYVCSY